MKSAIPIAAMALLSPTAVTTATADRQSLTAAADAFDAAQIAKDGPALESMVMDDLVFIDGTGRRLGKREFIAGWTVPGDTFDPIVLVDRTVTMLGRDAGVVGAEVNLCGTSSGERFCSRIRFADTFARKNGERWRAVHIQVTPIKR